MKFDLYERKAWSHVQELLDLIEEHDLEKIRKLCLAYGSEPARNLLFQEPMGFHQFLQSAPQQRKKMTRNLPEINYAILLVGALHLARLSAQLLQTITNNTVEPGPSYRDMTGRSALAALELLEHPTPFWPFEGPPSPYDDPYPLGSDNL